MKTKLTLDLKLLLLFSLVIKGNYGRFFFCRDPGTPENAVKITQFGSVYRFYIGSTVEYNCTAGYVLRGSSTVTCNLLIKHPFVVVGWQPALPQCIGKQLIITGTSISYQPWYSAIILPDQIVINILLFYISSLLSHYHTPLYYSWN